MDGAIGSGLPGCPEDPAKALRNLSVPSKVTEHVALCSDQVVGSGCLVAGSGVFLLFSQLCLPVLPVGGNFRESHGGGGGGEQRVNAAERPPANSREASVQ